MDVMSAMRLHEIRKPARTADASNRGDLLVKYLPLLDQLEIKRENRKIAAARAPGGMIGGNGLFG